MHRLLYLAVAALVVALISAALGFGGLAGGWSEWARYLFWAAIALFGISVGITLVRD